MQRIIYLSTSSRLMEKQDIKDILRASRRNNPSADITGMLAYHDGAFFQVLEGPRDAVRTLLARIDGDPRHSNMLTMWSETVSTRCFRDWNMAYLGFDDAADDADLNPQSGGSLSLREVAAHARNMTDDKRVNLLLTSFLRNFRDLEIVTTSQH